MQYEATAERQRELQARHRDLTKTLPATGSTGESLRAVKGFENLSDDILQERATFNLKDHMASGAHAAMVTTSVGVNTVNLSAMSRDELLGLADAALTEASRKPETENR